NDSACVRVCRSSCRCTSLNSILSVAAAGRGETAPLKTIMRLSAVNAGGTLLTHCKHTKCLDRSESRWGAVETLPVLPAHTMPKLDIPGPLSRASAAIASRLGPGPEQLPEPIEMIGCAPAAVGDAKMENPIKSFEPSIDHFIRIIGSGIEIFGVLVI